MSTTDLTGPTAPLADRRYRRRWYAFVGLAGAYLVVVSRLEVYSISREVFNRSTGVLIALAILALALRRAPETRSVWLLFSCYAFLNLGADIPYSYKDYWGDGVPPLWWTDVAYFASYGFALAGLFLLARKVSPGRDVETWIDSVVLALALISLVVTIIIGPTVSAAGGLSSDTVMGIVYPVFDVVVVAAILRLLIVRRAPNLSLTLLAASQVLAFSVDLWAGWQDATGNYSDYDTLWMAVFVMVLLAVSAPGADHFEPIPIAHSDNITVGRAAALAVAALVPPSPCSKRCGTESWARRSGSP